MTQSGKDDPGDKGPGDVSVTIQGNVEGQVAVGSHITQRQVRVQGAGPVTAEDLAALEGLLASLREDVVREAPEGQRQAALERIDELAEAVNAEEPDLSVMEYVKGWFGKHLPQLAGAVASVVVHPVVGKVVGAAGDLAAAEFRRRFGEQ